MSDVLPPGFRRIEVDLGVRLPPPVSLSELVDTPENRAETARLAAADAEAIQRFHITRHLDPAPPVSLAVAAPAPVSLPNAPPERATSQRPGHRAVANAVAWLMDAYTHTTPADRAAGEIALTRADGSVVRARLSDFETA